jgi:hypothetical protein
MHAGTKLQGGMFLAAAVAVLCISPALAQTNVPKYDLKTEAKVKGIVEELTLPAKGSPRQAAHLLVKNGTDMLDVYLCPESFLKEMGFTFSKGDEIALTGSKVKQEAGDLFLAREVVKGTDTLVIRDEKGGPVWNWRR